MGLWQEAIRPHAEALTCDPNRSMSYYVILFAPLALLLPAAGAVAPTTETFAIIPPESLSVDDEIPVDSYAKPTAPAPAETACPEGSTFAVVANRFRAQDAHQVRIEQQITIRISPRPQPMRPNMLMDLPNREVGPKFLERKVGKCVKVAGIAGVQPDQGNRLLLYMRDQRIISAELERACRSRDFYSGFYLSRSSDGQLCVDRDMLLSRSGANCRLTQIRQLVESER